MKEFIFSKVASCRSNAELFKDDIGDGPILGLSYIESVVRK